MNHLKVLLLARPFMSRLIVTAILEVFLFCFTDEKTQAQKDSGHVNSFSVVELGFQDCLTDKAVLFIWSSQHFGK